jgi:hypothetical protein
VTDGATRRTVPVIAAELADVRRHLVDVPPHHGGGGDHLERRVRELERELARARAELGDSDA